MNRTALYVALMVIAAGAGGFLVARRMQQATPQLSSGTALPQPRQLAAFQLTDHRGAAFGRGNLAGAPSLMFFGFTHCPDVCPTTLAMMAQLGRDPQLSKLRLLFVTVDPERDDQLTLQHYVDAFGGRLVGLRGTDAQLDPLMQSVGAARSIQKLAGGDYTVDHSATLFFIDAGGNFAAVFNPPFAPAELRADLLQLVAGG